ncbi:MAG: hypothetical protein ACE5OZ_21305 [Candidatus Heimdallarchaeota archaeon]
MSEEINLNQPIVRVFNLDNDLDNCVQLFLSDFNLPEEDVRNFLLSINSNESTIAHLVLQDGKRIVAHGAVEQSTREPTKGGLNAIHATETTYLSTLLTSLSSNCKKNGIKTLYMNFTHLDNDSPQINPYKALGFTYTGVDTRYKKEIE